MSNPTKHDCEIREKEISGIYEIKPEIHADHRGHLNLTNTSELLIKHDLNINWKEEYHSYTKNKFCIKGLYIQLEPYVETKMITAINGDSLWVNVDLRENSSTFGKWTSTLLSGKLNNSVYVSGGFANGCVSLTENVDLFVKADNFYSVEHGVGIKWDDKDLDIDWRIGNNTPIVSKWHDNFESLENFKELIGKH